MMAIILVLVGATPITNH